MEKNNFNLIILAALVLASSIAIGEGLYIFIPKNSSAPTPQSETIDNRNIYPNIPLNAQGTTVVNKSAQTINPPAVTPSNFKIYRDSVYGFQFKYPTNIFKLYEQTDMPPASYNSTAKGVKIIALDRVNYLGTPKCTYGQSLMTQFCTLGNESGISFEVANASIKTVTVPYEGSLTNTTVAKKPSSVLSVGTNSVGANADTYFIPLNSNHTLVITRLYRTDGLPSQVQLNDILQTLQLN